MKTFVANLYNPHEQSKEELIENFVVRHKVFKKLFREIKSSDMIHPEQHYLIVGQRGMGKTTLLIRLCYEIENDADLKSLIPVVLKEEAHYGIGQLFQLWETVAQEIENRDTSFSGLSAQMEKMYNENADYERICFDMLVKALEARSKKIILFIDNMGEMFQHFSDMESHRLREILMNCPHLRIIGASTVVLEAFFKYQHAFYEYFRQEHLEELNREETRCLLSKLAKTEEDKKRIQRIIKEQPGRVETLRIMTGGVIRTIVLLFEIFLGNENGNAIGDLERILDRVTPLYKHRMDDLTPMQRQAVNVIALNWDAISPEEIAQKTRMRQEQVNTVIKELENVFIIQRVATDTGSDFYHLRERFFNIWYLMRHAPKGSQTKVIWLVRFLEVWYDKEGLVQRAKLHIQLLAKGDYHPKAAYYMTEALARTCKLNMEIEHELISKTKAFLSEKDKSLLTDLSPSDKELLEEGIKYVENNDDKEAVNCLLKIKNKNEMIYYRLGFLYQKQKEYGEAEKLYLMAAETGRADAIFNLGNLYKEQKEHGKAEKFYLMAVEKGHAGAMYNLGNLYKEQKEHGKAEKFYLMAVETGHAGAMYNLGILYHEHKEYANAEKYWLMAAETGNAEDMNSLAWFYFEQKTKKQEALKYAEQSVKKKKYIYNSNTLSCVYIWHNMFEDAVQIAKEFIYDDEFYKKFEQDVILYLMLLLAKNQYRHVANYFEDPKLNLKERFKPLYYALLRLSNDKNYYKMPPELAEPVKEIIEKVKQIAADYA